MKKTLKKKPKKGTFETEIFIHSRNKSQKEAQVEEFIPVGFFSSRYAPGILDSKNPKHQFVVAYLRKDLKELVLFGLADDKDIKRFQLIETSKVKTYVFGDSKITWSERTDKLSKTLERMKDEKRKRTVPKNKSLGADDPH